MSLEMKKDFHEVPSKSTGHKYRLLQEEPESDEPDLQASSYRVRLGETTADHHEYVILAILGSKFKSSRLSTPTFLQVK